jgi:hypothetical protein
MKKKNFNLTDESNDRFDQILEQISTQQPGITQGEVFAKLVDAYLQRPEPENPVLAQQCSELADSLNLLRADIAQFLESTGHTPETRLQDVASALIAEREEHANLVEQLSSVREELRKKMQEAMQFNGISGEDLAELRRNHQEELEKLEEFFKLSENQILITLPSPQRELLEESCNRLSALYDKEVLPADLLLDVFTRYTVEQYSEWFFPFVIKPTEMEKITGYTHHQLKQWLKNGKKE